MSKLVKSVVYPFTGAQPPLTTTDHRTVPSRDDVITFYKTHERLSWSLTETARHPVDRHRHRCADADRHLRRRVGAAGREQQPRLRRQSHRVLQGGSGRLRLHHDVGHRGVEALLRPRRLPDESAHRVRRPRRSTVSRHDADAVAAIEASIRRALGEDISDVREASLTNWGIPNHYVPVQVVANTTFQEFVTAEFYRHHAQQTKEPVLAKHRDAAGEGRDAPRDVLRAAHAGLPGARPRA